MHSFLFSLRGNSKTAIPTTTTSSDSCPESCGFRGNGCYAESGPLGMIWRNLSATRAGDTFKNGRNELRAMGFAELLKAIKALPAGSLWRHNQAGDLPGKGMTIDAEALDAIVKANRGKNGFTYTHKPAMGANLAAIRKANQDGFTVNVSADSATHAARLKAMHPDLPVVCVLPIEAETARVVDVDGHKITVCPATRKDESGKDVQPDMTCAKCGLCAVRDRRAIVGFPAHGASKRKANAVAVAA